MSNRDNNFEHIPQEKFRFVQMDERLHDKKLETKARSFFQDAMLRFSKNKSSVVAAWILLFLILFSLIAPLVSPYTMQDKDNIYKSYPSYVPAVAKMNLGFMDGSTVHGNQNERSLLYWKGIAVETGLDPVLKVVGTHSNLVKQRGQMVEVKTYDLKVNRYFENGIVYRTLSYSDFQKLQDWQNETGIQVIYPYVELADIENLQDSPNIWYKVDSKGKAILDSDGNFIMSGFSWVSLVCALVTLLVVVLCSTYGKKMAKLIPFIIGIGAGYVVALAFTLIGMATENPSLMILDFAPFKALVADGVTVNTFLAVPKFTFLTAIDGIKEFNWTYVATIAVAYVPVAFVVFAEHIADHKNLSSIIESDLTVEPGLHRTLLGDGIGSMAGAFFGGCPNTTYGESVGCVAITGNASVATITTTAIMAILISFVSPFVALLDSIPGCVMGGVCVTLYGFIAVSGLKMIQKVDLEDNANLFTVSVILICGIGGMAMAIGPVKITSIACALILGIIVNLLLHRKKA